MQFIIINTLYNITECLQSNKIQLIKTANFPFMISSPKQIKCIANSEVNIEDEWESRTGIM